MNAVLPGKIQHDYHFQVLRICSLDAAMHLYSSESFIPRRELLNFSFSISRAPWKVFCPHLFPMCRTFFLASLTPCPFFPLHPTYAAEKALQRGRTQVVGVASSVVVVGQWHEQILSPQKHIHERDSRPLIHSSPSHLLERLPPCFPFSASLGHSARVSQPRLLAPLH